MRISLAVNGTPVTADVEPRLLLVDLLREHLGLTGTKVGCDTGQCGSCTVLLDDRCVVSCCVLAVQADGARVGTVEGDNRGSELDTLQRALWEQHGTQCGFCTPGVVVALRELLVRDPHPDEATVRSWLSGNLCRCTGYHGIVRAVRSVTEAADG
jgi:aerobic carbon-monoxide dehydrogenase small subunit